MFLLGAGVAVAVIGAVVLADEWRRSATPRAVVFGFGLRLEVLAIAAVLVGLGAALVFGGVTG